MAELTPEQAVEQARAAAQVARDAANQAQAIADQLATSAGKSTHCDAGGPSIQQVRQILSRKLSRDCAAIRLDGEDFAISHENTLKVELTGASTLALVSGLAVLGSIKIVA